MNKASGFNEPNSSASVGYSSASKYALLLFAMLFIGATGPFLFSWATPFEAWRQHNVFTFPLVSWFFLLMIALYPLGVIDFHRNVLVGKIRVETWYAYSFTIALLILVVGTSLYPLPEHRVPTSLARELRWACITGVFGAVMGIAVFLILSLVWKSIAWLWQWLRGNRKTGIERAGLTLKTLFFWVTIVAVNLAVFLGNSQLIEHASSASYSLDEATISVGVYLLGGLICFPLGRWLRRTANFVSTSVVLLTVPVLLVIGWLLFFPPTIGDIQQALFHFILLWFYLITVLILWHVGIRGVCADVERTTASSRFRKPIGNLFFWSSCGAWVFALGWLVWHWVAPNSSPDPTQIRTCLASHIDANAEAESDWVNLWNQQHGGRLLPEENGVVDLLELNAEALAYNRVINGWQASHQTYFEELGVEPEDYASWLEVIGNSQRRPRELRLHRNFDVLYAYSEWWSGLPEEKRKSLRENAITTIKNAMPSSKLRPIEKRSRLDGLPFVPTVLRPDLLVENPWADDAFEPGVAFLESVSDELDAIEKLAKKDFFWPLVRIPSKPCGGLNLENHEVDRLAFMIFHRPMKLLRMAAMNDSASNRMEEAIERCVTLKRLCHPRCSAGAYDTTTLEHNAEQMHIDTVQTIFAVALSRHATDDHRLRLIRLLGELETPKLFSNEDETNLRINLMLDRYVASFDDDQHVESATVTMLMLPWTHLTRAIPRAINWSDYHAHVRVSVDENIAKASQLFLQRDARLPERRYTPPDKSPAATWMFGGAADKAKQQAARFAWVGPDVKLYRKLKRWTALAQFGIAVESYRRTHGEPPEPFHGIKDVIFESIPDTPNLFVWGALEYRKTGTTFQLSLPANGRSTPELQGPLNDWLE